MNIFTIADIRGLDPCYDPAKYLPEDWQGTALDILRVAECPPRDRLWVVCHEGWIDDRIMRLFAVWCARRALSLVDNPDPNSVAACDVAERYANGEATRDDLTAARTAARTFTWSDAGTAAWDATWSVAGVAAWDATRDAARYVTGVSAGAVAWATAVAEQIVKLVEMLTD